MRRLFSSARLPMLISLALALVTVVLYWPVSRNEFIAFDDAQYISENPSIQNGVTWAGIKWAFTTGYASNWHPLAWISHMLDCQFYGLNPGGHHLTNVFFHAATSVLVFIWLLQLTGATWRCAFVAAFFAWHPLHVESVAWAAERKDVLCAFFWMLTLLAYTKYARQRSGWSYAGTLILFALALMAKPMAVTLPCVLLLIDFWPLNRIHPPVHGDTDWRNFFRQAGRLFAEKIPFFVLAAVASVITYLVQDKAGATWSLASLPPQTRIANALLAYYRYVSKTFWPVDLAIIYPLPMHWPWYLAAGVAIVLLAWIGVFIWKSRPCPYLLMGWLWFLGTLVPTIGLVQVGSQSMADRYTYLPSIGLFIVIVWGACDLVKRWPEKEKFLPIGGGVALAGCLMLTSIQIGYWQNSIKLFTHAVDATGDNFIAFNSLGSAFKQRGQYDKALLALEESVRLESRYGPSQYNLAKLLLDTGRTDDAFAHFSQLVQLMPNRADLRAEVGTYLAQHNRPQEAATQLLVAVKLNPADFNAWNILGWTSLRLDKPEEALGQLDEAIKLNPDLAEVYFNRAFVLNQLKQPQEAMTSYAKAVELNSTNLEYRFNYGLSLLDNQQPSEAEKQFIIGLNTAPEETKFHYRLAQALEKQGKSAEAVAQYRETLRLLPDFPDARTALDKILADHTGLKTAP